MDEQDWLTCTDPRAMLDFLLDRASERKLRLFACACCRRIWSLLAEAGARQTLETAELFADRLVGDAGRSAARKLAQQATQCRGTTPRPQAPRWQRRAASAVYYAAARDIRPAVFTTSLMADEALIFKAGGYEAFDPETFCAAEHAPRAGLLRDLVGNPFRPIALDFALRTPAVLALAQAAYDNRTLPAGTLELDRLAVLADALEEAGCTDADILGHLRGPGPHVRGCFPLDLILDKS